MYRLTKRFTFEASHQLPLHDLKCRRLHGHSWKGAVIVEGLDLVTDGPKSGMLIDYGELSAILKPIIEEKLDHWHLNDSLGLPNPTSEAIAKWLYDILRPKLGGMLVSVAIDETCTCSCEYRGQ